MTKVKHHLLYLHHRPTLATTNTHWIIGTVDFSVGSPQTSRKKDRQGCRSQKNPQARGTVGFRLLGYTKETIQISQTQKTPRERDEARVNTLTNPDGTGNLLLTSIKQARPVSRWNVPIPRKKREPCLPKTEGKTNGGSGFIKNDAIGLRYPPKARIYVSQHHQRLTLGTRFLIQSIQLSLKHILHTAWSQLHR